MKFKFITGKNKTGKNPDGYLLDDNSSFSMTESYNALRTNIMYSLTKGECGKVIMLTSAEPGEGKSTTAVNIAVTFAHTGARVLLIDCDLRKAMIHRYARIDGSVGVTNVLCGYADLGRAIRRRAYRNVDILPAGELPPDPTQILSAPEFGDMLSALTTKYDYIFIDTPPASFVTDAAIISKCCNGTIVVVREGVTNFDRLSETINGLNKSGTGLLGFVVLKSEKNHKSYSYYGSEKSDFGYGYRDTPKQID